MQPYIEGKLRIDVSLAERALVLHWRGTSNARDPDASLRPFFERVAGEATRDGRRVELRLHELDYFNSSTIASIIRAIRRLTDQHTHVRVSYPNSGWQTRALDALRVMLEHEGKVELVGEPA